MRISVFDLLNGAINLSFANDAAEQFKELTLDYPTIDSREANQNSLFFALRGKNSHGHEYVETFFNNGGTLAIVEDRSLFASINRPIIEVPDSLVALHQLAKWWRAKLHGKIFAVTGSMGKTTVKNCLAAILTESGLKGSASFKSFNNHTGVPLTLLRAEQDDQFVIVEMGMNHPLEIARLAEIAKPYDGIITTVASVHIGNFKDISEIAKAKFEIAAGMNNSNILILPEDSLEVANYLAHNRVKPIIRYIGPKAGPNNVSYDRVINNGLEGFTATYTINEGRHITASSPLIGIHHAHNVACAIAGATVVNPEISDKSLIDGIKLTPHGENRGELIPLTDSTKLFMDCHNANPYSMKAFLELLSSAINFEDTLLILGDMGELGETRAGAWVERVALPNCRQWSKRNYPCWAGDEAYLSPAIKRQDIISKVVSKHKRSNE